MWPLFSINFRIYSWKLIILKMSCCYIQVTLPLNSRCQPLHGWHAGIEHIQSSKMIRNNLRSHHRQYHLSREFFCAKSKPRTSKKWVHLLKNLGIQSTLHSHPILFSLPQTSFQILDNSNQDNISDLHHSFHKVYPSILLLACFPLLPLSLVAVSFTPALALSHSLVMRWIIPSKNRSNRFC